jgi:hypothetical protein
VTTVSETAGRHESPANSAARASRAPAPRTGNGAGHGGPASGIPARRWEPFELGNTVALRHGAYSQRLVGPLAEEIGAELAEIVAGTPAEAPMFAAARSALALKLARLRHVTAWIAEHHAGLPLDADGNPLPAAKLEAELLAGIEKSLDALGLTPTAAARLGVDLLRGSSLQEALHRDEMERGRELRVAAERRDGGTEAAEAEDAGIGTPRPATAAGPDVVPGSSEGTEAVHP